MPHAESNSAHAPQRLSLCSRAREVQLLKSASSRAPALQQEEPPYRSLRIITRVAPAALEKAHKATKTQHSQKEMIFLKN